MRLFIIIGLSFFSLTSCGQEGNKIFKQEKPPLDSITKVLEAIYITDQAPREALEAIGKNYGTNSKEMKEQWKTIRTTDSINLVAVSAILDRYGWLSEKETSERAHDVLWLVIQHSDSSTQLKYLPQLQQAVKEGKVKPKRYAYLLDRIHTNQGKFQIYGSQFQVNPSGKTFVYPIADEPTVNQRRKEVGLEPLEVYAKEMRLDYKVPKEDQYKDKIVAMGFIVDTAFKPLEGIKVFSEDQLLTTTNSHGEYFIVLNKKDKSRWLQLKKEGYQLGILRLEGDKDVYEAVFIMNRLQQN